jgi:hypothetical protein
MVINWEEKWNLYVKENRLLWLFEFSPSFNAFLLKSVLKAYEATKNRHQFYFHFEFKNKIVLFPYNDSDDWENPFGDTDPDYNFIKYCFIIDQKQNKTKLPIKQLFDLQVGDLHLQDIFSQFIKK